MKKKDELIAWFSNLSPSEMLSLYEGQEKVGVCKR